MKFLSILLLSLSFSFSALAHNGASPLRYENENYEAARSRFIFDRMYEEVPFRRISVEGAKKPLASLNIKDIPDLGTYSVLENEFKFIRDTRFLKSDDANFPRRLTWLYPDDGCYARAEMAKIELQSHHVPQPKKLFVFGDLSVNTKNSYSGSVQWWYHVAVTYRVGDEAYVIDPAIEPLRPLKISEWDAAVGGANARTQYSICSKDAYDPTSDCATTSSMDKDDVVTEQQSFLQAEWYRLLDLKRDPTKELGEFPPWLQN